MTRPADVNCVSFSHQHDVTSPVSTPDGECGNHGRRCAAFGDLAVCNHQERSAPLSAPAEEAGWGGAGEGVQAGTQLQPRYSWKKLAQQRLAQFGGRGGDVYDVSTL